MNDAFQNNFIQFLFDLRYKTRFLQEKKSKIYLLLSDNNDSKLGKKIDRNYLGAS